MKKPETKQIVITGFTLFAICLISTFLLALTNQVTAPKITALADRNAEQARKQILSTADSFSKPLQINLDGTDYTYYKGFEKDGKTTAGYVFTTVTKGYGGDVKIMSGLDKNGVVKGIQILELTETAGLGMEAKNKSFLDQFLNKSGSVSVVKTAAGKDEIQALTGATITSSAVTGAVNIALDLYKAVADTEKAEPSTAPGLNADDSARKALLPAAMSFSGPLKTTLSSTDYNYYTGIDKDGNLAGYIFTTDARGYQSNVIIETGVDAKGVITGVDVVEINDSPGLGMNAKNDSFLNQYKGLSGNVSVVTGSAGTNEVQAITGATITSTGVTKAINIALSLYKSVSGGNK